MSDSDTEHGRDDLADLTKDAKPVRRNRPLPANIIRRPIQLPPMVRVQDA